MGAVGACRRRGFRRGAGRAERVTGGGRRCRGAHAAVAAAVDEPAGAGDQAADGAQGGGGLGPDGVRVGGGAAGAAAGGEQGPDGQQRGEAGALRGAFGLPEVAGEEPGQQEQNQGGQCLGVPRGRARRLRRGGGAGAGARAGRDGGMLCHPGNITNDS